MKRLTSLARMTLFFMLITLFAACQATDQSTEQSDNTSTDTTSTADASPKESEPAESLTTETNFPDLPKVRFTFDNAPGASQGGEDTPYSYVSLNIEAESASANFTLVHLMGNAQQMSKEEQQRLGFPDDALDAFSGFWAGLSTMGYVTYVEGKGLRMQLVYADEATELPLEFHDVESFYIPYSQVVAYSKDDKPTPLTLEQAKVLVANANDAYWYLQSGGNGEQVVRLEYGGRTLGTDLDHLNKVRNYLAPYFSGEAVSILTSGLFPVEGRLGQQEADGGSLLDWTQAKIALSEDGPTKKVYKFAVPMGDSGQLEELPVVLVYERGKGWCVHEPLPF